MKSKKELSTLVALITFSLLAAACSKSTKLSSAGGGSSSQSVLTFRGAAR